jgi:hypothetical protein
VNLDIFKYKITDEIIGYRYEVKEMPGLKVKDMEGKEIRSRIP